MSRFEAKHDELSRMGARIIGIGPDSSWSHRAFARALKLSFPLLSDWNRTVGPAYCGTYEEVSGHAHVSRRGVFVVDGAGTVRYRWVAEDPGQEPDPEEARLAVQEIVHE